MVPGVGIKGVRIISGSLKKTNIKEQVENAEAMDATEPEWSER